METGPVSTNVIDPGRNVIHAVSSADLQVEHLNAILERDTFACIRGLVSPESVARSVEALRRDFRAELDHPTLGERPSDIRKNFQKLLVGGVTQSDFYCSRFFRTFYNPIWEPDIYKMHDSYRLLMEVRNLLLGKTRDYAVERIEDDGMWSATRLHQYPIGGGYFSGHRDVVLIDVAQKNDLNFYQVILNMTKKGKDFERGGAYVVVNDQKINLDEVFEVGDIIVYYASTFHGVDEIDPHRRLDLNTINGRLTAFVSLYKAL
jgi:hypothetical protein